MKIRNKFFTIFIFFIVIPILIVSYILYLKIKTHIETDKLIEINSTADIIRDDIISYINHIKTEISILKDSLILKTNILTLSKYINDRDNPSFIDAIKTVDSSLFKTYFKNKELLDFLLIDTEGIVVYSTSGYRMTSIGEKAPEANEGNLREWRKGVWVSDIFKYNNMYEIMLVAPLISNDNKLKGFVAFEMSIEKICKIFSNKSSFGKTGESFLGIKDGSTVVLLSTSRYSGGQFQAEHRINLNSSTISKAIQGISGSALGTDDYCGTNVVAACRYIPLLKIGVLVKIDTNEAFHMVYYLKNMIIFISLTLIFLLLFAAKFISKILTVPINDLLEATYAIEHGNFDYKPKNVYKDEIGLLMKAIEKMAYVLGTTTISIENYEREIDEGKRQEQELRLTQEATLNILEDLNESASVLRQERDKTQKYFETASVIMIILNQDETVHLINSKGCEVFGYSKEEIEGKNWFDTFIPERLREEIKSVFYKIFNEKEKFPEYYENTVVTKDGSERLISWHNTLITDNKNITSILSAGEDITERKEQEQRIKKINELQHTLLARDALKNKLKLITSEIVNIFNADFARIWLVAPGDRCSTGCPHAAVTESQHICRLRDKCLHLVSSSGRYTHIDGGMHARIPFGCYKIGGIASGKYPSFLTNDVVNDPRIHNRDWAKDLGLVSFVGVKLSQIGNNPLGVMAFFSKKVVSSVEYEMFLSLEHTVINVISASEAEEEIVKHRDHLEELIDKRTEELKIANDLAQKANRAKSLFLANMSHEIRTPMNAIIGFSDLLYFSLHDEKQRAQIEAIRNSSRSLLTIINDILDLSKIEAEKMTIRREPADIAMLFKIVENIFMEKARDKGIDFTVYLEEDLPKTLVLDEVRVRQVLFNLVGNAVKFTDKGSVTLKVRKELKGKGKIDLVLVVEDTGIGIPKDQQELIFQAFNQQESQKVAKYGGTGLGLAISKRLTIMMGGSISVTSKPGKGSVFTVVIPDIAIWGEGSALKKEENSFDPYLVRFEKGTVLVADDDKDNRKLISDIFVMSSVRVLEAVNGIEALAIARKCLPDIIIMDLKMPKMDGREAARLIKRAKLQRLSPLLPCQHLSSLTRIKTLL